MDYLTKNAASSAPGKGMDQRSELSMRLAHHGRENSTATVLFHNAIADRLGLNATESKTLDLLTRQGALTAGEIARQTGLASASVTSLIDNLERKGFVRRQRDDKDRRRVIVEPVMEKIREFGPYFAVFGELTDELIANYEPAELELILDVMARVTSFMQRATERLRSEQDDDG